MRNTWTVPGVLLATVAAIAMLASVRGGAMRASGHDIPAPVERQESPAMVNWTGIIEVASGEAYQGPWRMNDSDFRYVDAPTVAVDTEGSTGVAWVDQARKDVHLQIYEPDSSTRFAEPVNVSRSPRVFSWLPRMEFGRGGSQEIYILWQEIVFSGGTHGGEIYFARSTDGGRSFSDPLNLSNTPAGAGKGRLTTDFWHNGSLDLALGPDGVLFAAWTEYEGPLWLRRSTDGGASFGGPVRVAGDAAEPARGPALALGPADVVHLAWSVGEDPGADLRLATSMDGGHSFGPPRVLFAGPGHAEAPKLAVDRAGTLHLVFAESPAGPLRRYRLLYARSTDAGRSFDEPRVVAAGDAEVESVNFPALSLDVAGRIYLTWDLFPNHRERPRGLGFAYSTDDGHTFSVPAVVPGTVGQELGFSGSLQGLLMRKLAVNDAGAIAIVNSTFNPAERSRVRLIRGQFAGH